MICVTELIAEIVVPAGMPVPVTDSPTTRFAVLDSPVTTGEGNVVRLLPPGPLLAVVFVLRVMAVEELIWAIVVPAAMPFPVTDWPTSRLVVLDSPVIDFCPGPNWPFMVEVWSVPVKLVLDSVPVKLVLYSVPVKLVVCSVPVKLPV